MKTITNKEIKAHIHDLGRWPLQTDSGHGYVQFQVGELDFCVLRFIRTFADAETREEHEHGFMEFDPDLWRKGMPACTENCSCRH